jgi:hypothetical protein
MTADAYVWAMARDVTFFVCSINAVSEVLFMFSLVYI